MADELELSNLKNKTIAQLRELWTKQVGRGEPPKIKILLLRELAWHAQQSLQGGMDADTRTLLRAVIRQAKGEPVGEGKDEARRQAGGQKGARVTPKSPRPQLRPGSKLVRAWHGVEHEVMVLENGKRFEYRGETYRSLTQIARLITGTHWSGPRFFGLHRVGSMR